MTALRYVSSEHGSKINSAGNPLDFLDGIAAMPAWYAKANCVGTDPESFFPDKGGSASDARRVCVQCPVRKQCLQWALDTDERYGVYGGLTERERRDLKHGIRTDDEPRELRRTTKGRKLDPGTRKPCDECGVEFLAFSQRMVLCSHECRKSRRRKQERERRTAKIIDLDSRREQLGGAA